MILNWRKKAPDKKGWWLRMNAIHKPEVHYVNSNNGYLETSWGGRGATLRRIKDISHKLEHFYWAGPFNIPEREPLSKR